MSEFRLRVPSGIPLRTIFDEMPQSIRGLMRDAFSSIALLPQKDWPAIAEAAIEAMASPSDTDTIGRALAKKLARSEENSKLLITGSTFSAWVVSSRTEPIPEIIVAAQEAGVISQPDHARVEEFWQLIARNRDQIKATMDRTRLGASVLPSMTDFRVAVDIRLGFEGTPSTGPTEQKNITIAVPVAVVHIDTDAYNQEIWFQLSRPELEGVISDLEDALKRIKAAEQWAGAR